MLQHGLYTPVATATDSCYRDVVASRIRCGFHAKTAFNQHSIPVAVDTIRWRNNGNLFSLSYYQNIYEGSNPLHRLLL